MKTLIIGGAGFVGFHLAQSLLERGGHDLTIADNLFRGKMDEHLKQLVERYSVNVVTQDFTKESSFEALSEHYDYVYMLASMVGVDYTTKMPNEIIRVNGRLILNTLEWLSQGRCGKALFTSTSECYAGTIESFGYAIPTPEDVPLCIQDIRHPRFTYAVTKMLGESGFFSYASSFGFDATVVRYHNVFGPRMGFKHVIPHLVQRFRSHENPFKIYGHDQTRAFCFVSDAVAGTILAMEHGESSGEIFHIGAPEEITIEELTKTTGELMSFKGTYEHAPTYPGSVSRRCPDISKARTMLGYQPRVDWRLGLQRTVEWYDDYLRRGQHVFE